MAAAGNFIYMTKVIVDRQTLIKFMVSHPEAVNPSTLKNWLLQRIIIQQREIIHEQYADHQDLWDLARNRVLDPLFGVPTKGISIEDLIHEVTLQLKPEAGDKKISHAT